MEQPAQKRRGRPVKAPEDKLRVASVRLSASQKETLQAIGRKALRDWLDQQGKVLARAKRDARRNQPIESSIP